MEKFRIFTVVGPSGSGKSALIAEAAKQLFHSLGIIRSCTTRPRRSEEDGLFYDFVGSLEMAVRYSDGRLARAVTYAGNFYGTERAEIDRVLGRRHGILATTPAGAVQLEEADYRISVVRIIPMFHEEPQSEARQQADLANMEHPLKSDLEIINSFSAGGKQRAAGLLVRFIKSFIP